MEPPHTVKPFYWPPTLLVRQTAALLSFGYLIGWRSIPAWFVKHGFKSIPVSSGALGMGCIGFPAHPAWEVTSACNLKCIHCHASGGKPAPDEMDTQQAKKFIRDLAKCPEFRMLVYTGGEPLVRHDIMELMDCSRSVGFQNVIATNGTLIDDSCAKELKRVGVVGAAISLDAPTATGHDFVRNSPRAFDLAMRGIQAVRKAGILLQINVTAMEYNIDVLGDIIDLADLNRAAIMLMYQLVPVGRGETIDHATLDLEQNKRLLMFLRNKQRNVETIIEPVAGPQYWPYLMEHRGFTGALSLKVAEKIFHGCTAGRGFVYIKPNGDIWPCPFVPVFCGNAMQEDFTEIWTKSVVLQNLRSREKLLKGKCGTCRYSTICGGCRGRALALSGDYLGADPSCFLPERPRFSAA